MTFKLAPLSAILMVLFAQSYADAAVVRSDIAYQTYRDFGENKGVFVPGALNLPILDTNGNLIGNLDKAPMADFSSASTDGVGTLVAPQYSGSVKHNIGYTSLQFGGTGANPDYLRHTYRIVDRNDHPSLDYHTPRLHKYVTEVAPAALLDVPRDTYLDTERFPALYRLGSGAQYVRDADWNITFLAYPYDYLVGGTVSPLYKPAYTQEVRANSGLLYNLPQSPLTSYADQGDSGSPLYAWDTQTQQWVLVGFQMGGWGSQATEQNTETNWVVYQTEFNRARYEEDQEADVNNSGNLRWQLVDGQTSRFVQDNGDAWQLHIKDSSQSDDDAAMNAGKNITLNGNGGEIVLQDSINQGAGGLTFQGDYTVKAESGQTWQGAGIIVADDATVDWQINGVEGDFLHKLGTGTLNISGSGQNPGSLSAGDGTIILAQQADEAGNRQAFDTVRIASGRPTVVLADSHQVVPDNIYFGYRGGRLDVNGNELTFGTIHNVDNGAQIVNHNADKTAEIRVVGDTEVTIHSWDRNSLTGTVGSLYAYPQNNGSVQYFMLKTSSYGYFPNAASNDRWAYLGTDQAKAIDIYLTAKNNAMFQGVLGETDTAKTNGNLNFRYTAPTSASVFTLSGGSNLNGEIEVDKGTLLLSGHPVLHAADVVIDDDWTQRHFKADSFKATDGATLQLGNYADLEGNISAGAGSSISLGYSKGANGWDNSWQCTRSDSSGIVSCNQNALSETLYAQLPHAEVKGNIDLAAGANLNLGKVNYTGIIQGAADSNTQLMQDARWTLGGSSTVGNLHTAAGSHIELNGQAESGFNVLTVNGNLSGNGTFEINSSLADMKSDRVEVNGLAEGAYTFALNDSGKKPLQSINLLPLMSLNNDAQDWQIVSASLQNEFVDIGGYRYVLARNENNFALYNALVSASEQEVPLEPITQAEQEVPLEPIAQAEQEVPLEPITQAEQEVPLEPITQAEQEVPLEPITQAEQEVPLEPIAQLELGVPPEAADPSKPEEILATPVEPVIQRDWISKETNTALSEHNARIHVLTRQQASLNRYLNQLEAERSGVWLNLDQEQMKYSSNDYRTYQQSLSTQQVGADKAVPFDGGNWMVGLAFTHSKADNSFAEGVGSTTDNHALSLYQKMIFDNQLYANLVAGYSRLQTRFNASDDRFTQNVWNAAAGIGKRWSLRNGVSIQPGADISYYRFDGADYRIGDAEIHSKPLSFWQLRGGLSVDKAFELQQGNSMNLYAAAHYATNLNNQQQLYVNNQPFHAALFKRWVEGELGLAFGLGLHTSITVRGGYARGDSIESQFNGGLELKYRW